MRTKSFSLLALAAVFTLSACGGSQNSNSNSAASGTKAAGLDVNKTYIVATDASYAPMEYMENNAVVGSRSGKQGLANVRTASGRHDRTRGRPA